MMIELVCSGGQTGADSAGLEAAYQCGIQTSGWAPPEYMTKDGPNPKLLRDKYHLGEHSGKGYKPRTYGNVKMAQGTIRCCVDFYSPGEVCTLNAIKQYKQTHFDIYLLNPPSIDSFVIWLLNNDITILNIAGNTQGTRDVDIYSLTYHYLIKTFQRLKAIMKSEEYYERFTLGKRTDKDTK